MWTDEVIFSNGDLSSSEYDEFIEKNYNGNLNERFEHIESIIDRLIIEREFILMFHHSELKE